MDFQDDELKEILNIFRAESEEIIERLNNTLLELEKKPTDKDLIVLLFRDAHSLKGAARMIGFTATQNLAHKIEDILGLAKDNQLRLTTEIADTMYKSVDLISKIIEQSIETGNETFNVREIQSQIDLLENIQNQKENTITITPTVEAESFNKTEFINKIDRINYLIINSLITIIKLAEKIEQNYIITLLDNITELTKYFQTINHFEIKTELEDIRLKLEIVVKCNTELSIKEVEEIQQKTDKILNELTQLCEYNDIKPVDYYAYAFDEKNYEKGFEISATAEIVETEPQKQFEININEIKDKINANEYTTEIITQLNQLKQDFSNADFEPLLTKIINLLELIEKTNTKPDDWQVEIISNGLNYCFNEIEGKASSENIALLEQQITVAKQLLEITNPTENQIQPVSQTGKNENKEQNKLVSNKKVRDFSKLLNSGEIKTLHVDSSKLDAMVSQIGELISTKIKTTKQLSKLSALEKNLEDCQKNFSKLLQHIKLYDKKKLQSDLKLSDNSSILFLKQFVNSFAEQNKKLNAIVNEYNKIQRSNIEEDMKMRVLIDDFDGMVKNIRILPLATVFHLFGRMVRDIAKERGKEIELTITGSETSADKKIIEEIKNPLIHIIRNSIDHGIETPEKRLALGKSPVGHLQINAKHLENKILIEVIDDGQGFNVQKIRDKAIQKGFLTAEELDKMSDDEIINIVFLPGFTTGDEVTSISGRGIGMDVVKSKIAQLNGVVKVISEFNVGSKIQIELPVTMATMTAFLIQSSNQTFAVPMSVINIVVCKKDDEILNNHDALTILHDGKNIPVYKLSNLLNLQPCENSNTFQTILILETNNRTIGIIVDKLLGEQEILHKKLSPPIYRLKNISGITTLASGETCLILNTIDLINSATLQKANLSALNAPAIVDKKTVISYKKLLIVDDSITTRTLEKSVLSHAGFNVETAINPIEAFKMLNQTRYDLILSDIEMPEMSGLEFLAQLKANELYSDIPVIIMSSLSDETTRRKAKTLGAEDFLIKSDFNKQKFIETVTDILLKYTD
ncbi:hybrid sensor histidine kinase/response regulator [bacterium]|nr:hybrid sensor histidine kinase/response regulator [bacterium]